MTGSTESYVEYVLDLLQPVKTVKSGKFLAVLVLKAMRPNLPC